MLRPLALILILLTLNARAAEPPCVVTTAFGEDCQKLLIKKLREGHKEIKAAIYEFTKKDIAEAFIDRAEHGVKVTIKVDAHEAESEYSEGLLARFQHSKIKIERIKMPNSVKMHNKFIVIDDRIVVTGSYNWTRRATEENWENLVAIESPTVAAEYAAEWARIQSVSRGIK